MPVDDGFTESHLSIKNFISIRHVGPYEEVNATWARLTQFAFERGISGRAVIAFGLCHDSPDETVPEEIRYDACLGVPPETYTELAHALQPSPGSDFSGIRLETMTPQKTIMHLHRGSYASLRDTYALARNSPAVAKAGAVLMPSIEIYKNNPLFTKPDALLTEVHFRLSQN